MNAPPPIYVEPEIETDVPGNGMMLCGTAIAWLSVIVLLASFFMPTTADAPGYDAVTNLGKIQLQSMVAMAGATFTVVGVLRYVGGAIVMQIARQTVPLK